MPALHRGLKAGENSEIFEKTGVSEQFVLVLMLALHGGQVANVDIEGLSAGVRFAYRSPSSAALRKLMMLGSYGSGGP